MDWTLTRRTGIIINLNLAFIERACKLNIHPGTCSKDCIKPIKKIANAPQMLDKILHDKQIIQERALTPLTNQKYMQA